MNALAVLILTAMLASAAIELTADILNLRRLRTSLPTAFEGWYDANRYAKAQNYLQTNTRFGWIASMFDLAVVLLVWFAKGFTLLDQWVRGFHLSPVITGLLYIGVLMGFKALLDLPLSIYATFVIEERFGFNKTTWSTYIIDKIKSLFLAVILGAPLLAAVLVFFEYAGAYAWFYCWSAVTIFMLLVQYIAPTWIMPLFNRFETLPPGDLRDAITQYARSIDFALDNIYVMDGSKRSTKSNAFFTGFGRHRRIVLFDTLIARHEIEELVAVLAHEMGHYKQKHIRKMILISILQAGVMFYILSLFISYKGLFDAFYLQQVSVYAGLLFFGLLYAPLDGLLGIGLQGVSRQHEYAADRFAVKTAPKGMALVTALKKLSVDNLSNLQPHPFYVFLHYSHPPVLERIIAIKEQIESCKY